ncbi:MAG: ATP-dependent DNA helicase RecG [Chloroflexi bacterium]|nr:ATP-dependent DNA helicase RecG [Chloroflexota bacterium]
MDTSAGDILDNAREALRKERSDGARDKAVAGGVASYIKSVTTRLSERTDRKDALEKLKFLDGIFADYNRDTIPERRKVLAQAIPVIKDLEKIKWKDPVRKNPVVIKEDKTSAGDKVRKNSPGKQHVILNSSIQYLKGVGPKMAGKLERLGIKTVEDLLFHFPRRHEDRTNFRRIKDVHDDEWAVISGNIIDASRRMARRGLNINKILVEDDSDAIIITFFNQPYLARSLKIGNRIIAYGKVRHFPSGREMISPEIETLTDSDPIHTGRIVPVYPATEGIGQRYLRKIVKTAFESLEEELVDAIPPELKNRLNLMGYPEALREIHFPSGESRRDRARTRLAFEELLLLQLQVALMRKGRASVLRQRRYDIPDGFLGSFAGALPFKLTAAQARVMNEILEDLDSEKPMSRLLQGDVGSGKTAVSALGVYAAVKSGYQAAVMAPTEILAFQHLRKFGEYLNPLGIEVECLTSDVKGKKREKILEGLASGEIKVIVGTHAIIQEDVGFKNLALAVIDEQHRFGVLQRASLLEKGRNPDILVMTATPIPRTLALTLYGDLDISVIDEMPPGRLPVRTVHVGRDKEEKIFDFIRKAAGKGLQTFIICPVIEESDRLEVQSAIEEAGRLKNIVFPDLKVDLLHGRMKGKEKDEIMERFRTGGTDVLISTTVVEVGVDVPGAAVMLIENAERFGLSQLHQLRGRVGRSKQQSYCILISEPKTDIGKSRLEVITKYTDGFKVAEEDLKLRGPGEFAGTRQHGITDLKMADIIMDLPLLDSARKEARLLVDSGELEKEEYGPLREKLFRHYGRRLSRLH